MAPPPPRSPQRTPLEARLRETGRGIQDALRTALKSLGPPGQDLRPVHLMEAGLDKSLASRLVRLLGERDPLRALHAAPSPQGLTLVAARVRERGCDAPADAIEEARNALEAVLRDLGGRRTDLLVALAAWIPEERERQERDARRAVQRGWTALAGARAGALYRAAFVQTTAAGIECVVVQVDQDVRVLRPAEPVLLARLDGLPLGMDGNAPQTSLAGRALRHGAPPPVLPDLGTHPAPKLRVAARRDARGSAPEVYVAPRCIDAATAATVGIAWRTAMEPVHGAIEFEARPLRPTEALVLDLFVHTDLSPQPAVTAELVTSGDGARATLDPDALPSRAAGFSSSQVRSVGAILETLGREAGLDVGSFMGHRARAALPLPDERLILRWERVRSRPSS